MSLKRKKNNDKATKEIKRTNEREKRNKETS